MVLVEGTPFLFFPYLHHTYPFLPSLRPCYVLTVIIFRPSYLAIRPHRLPHTVIQFRKVEENEKKGIKRKGGLLKKSKSSNEIIQPRISASTYNVIMSAFGES